MLNSNLKPTTFQGSVILKQEANGYLYTSSISIPYGAKQENIKITSMIGYDGSNWDGYASKLLVYAFGSGSLSLYTNNVDIKYNLTDKTVTISGTISWD